jgi:AcrR family transcriptional regulator
VSPRPYQLGARQAAVDETRRKVLTAARDLLTEPAGTAAFTVDAVARRADVARATVYYRFGSKAGLLEALFDDLAADGRMDRLAEAFTTPDHDEALRRFVACFAGFWAADRLVLRRVRALATLDPDIGPLIAARDERRRDGARVLLTRRLGAHLPHAAPAAQPTDPPNPPPAEPATHAAPPSGTARPEPAAPTPPPPPPATLASVVDIVHTLTSFETFDTLAGPERHPRDVAPLVTDLVLHAAATLTTP